MRSRQNGKLWKWELVGDRTFYEAHFNHLLATKLESSGYGIRRTAHHFEVASVTGELVKKFSRRTKLIEQRARINKGTGSPGQGADEIHKHGF